MKPVAQEAHGRGGAQAPHRDALAYVYGIHPALCLAGADYEGAGHALALDAEEIGHRPVDRLL